MNSENDLSAWLRYAEELSREGVGFLDAETDVPLGNRFEVAQFLDSSHRRTYLGHLTNEILSDRREVRKLLKVACHTRREGGALFASTPLAIPLLYGSETDLADPEHLDVPALVARSELAFLLETACVTSLAPGTEGAAYLTPIEERLSTALRKAGVVAQAQVPIGHRRVDFLVEDPSTGGRIAVECDGAAFHDPAEDAQRDHELAGLGVRTIRFTGSAIFRDPDRCAHQVKVAIRELTHTGQHEGSDESESLVMSDQQMRAVRHRGGPARVAAPAGSGKTRVVDRRVRALVASGVDPSRICAISFTNPAVNEMRKRLKLGDVECHFTTVHKLAKTVAEARNVKKVLVQGISPERGPRTPSRWEIIRKLLDPGEVYMARPKDFWTDAVNEYRLSFEVPGFYDWPPKAIPKKERFLEICRTYDDILRKQGLTDFEGWVHDALRALASDAEFRSEWAGKFDYWIVDEYQDLPKAKLWLLRLLIAPARNLFVVGDDDQVIYEFAGASSAVFAEFVEQFPDASEYTLDKNYRSPHDLVVRSGWMIDRNKTRVEKNVTADRALEYLDRVSVSRVGEYDLIGEQFIRDLLDSGSPPESIAVLFRLRDMALPLERLLREAGIPFRPCANESFFNSRTIRAICAWLDLTTGETVDPESVNLTLQWPNRYLKTEQRETLVRHLSGIHDSGTLAEVAIGLANAEFNEIGSNAVVNWANAVKRVERNGEPTEILGQLKLRELAKNDEAPLGKTSAVVMFDIFFRLAAQFNSVQTLLRWIGRHRDDRDYEPTVEEGVETTEGLVTLTTVHKAKGKEWDHVAILGPPDGMPDGRAQTPQGLEEERRIAYVAFTRARETVLFGGSLQYADELERRKDGLTWEDYRAGRTAPSQTNLRERGWSPWETRGPTATISGSLKAGANADGSPEGSVKKKGVYVLRPDAPDADGEYACACGVRLWAGGVPPYMCPECGLHDPIQKPEQGA